MKFKTVNELPEINGLPPVLMNKDGAKINTAEEWNENRDYLKAMLKHYMYGDIPDNPQDLIDFSVTGEIIFSEEVFNRKAIHEFVKITFTNTKNGKDSTNNTNSTDKKISFVAEITRPNDSDKSDKSDKSHKCRVITYIAFPNARNYEVEQEAVVNRGYAIALFNYEQVIPDKNINDEVLPLHKMLGEDLELKAIAMWAFCNMRLIDYLDTTEYAIKDKYIVAGHSRNGKAALCAGIFDDRVKIVVPNNSGCGGCGCFRFLGGRGGLTQDTSKTESLETITTAFPHWFSKNMNQFYDCNAPSNNSQEQALNNKLPFDLHFNKALIAPRALLSLEAYGDEWANTYGSKLTHDAAKEVFDLLGVGDNISIQFREGGHEFNTQDWIKLLDFCDLHQ
jgi:hypothetical protein